jgi:hypothetical protein
MLKASVLFVWYPESRDCPNENNSGEKVTWLPLLRRRVHNHWRFRRVRTYGSAKTPAAAPVQDVAFPVCWHRSGCWIRLRRNAEHWWRNVGTWTCWCLLYRVRKCCSSKSFLRRKLRPWPYGQTLAFCSCWRKMNVLKIPCCHPVHQYSRRRS